MSDIQRIVIWRGLDDPSMEFFTLRQLASGWQLAGTVVAVAEEQPLRVTYSIVCTAEWHTRHAEVVMTDIEEEWTLSLYSSSDGSWRTSDQRLHDVHGCIDIDLGITPATNILPIRRHNLAVGLSADVDATWVRFPSLAIERLSQRYTRIADRRYRYESDTGFACDLDVDEDGIVTTYPGGWERVV